LQRGASSSRCESHSTVNGSHAARDQEKEKEEGRFQDGKKLSRKKGGIRCILGSVDDEEKEKTMTKDKSIAY
jgi:hypothetical protein